MEISSRITQELNCRAYWFDEVCLPKDDSKQKDYELYTMCDLVRGAAHVAIVVPTNPPDKGEH